MDVAALRRGELIAAVAGIALLIIMFLPWFGAGDVAAQELEIAQEFGIAEGVDDTANAWQSFDFIDVVLLVTVIVAVGLAVMGAAGTSPNLPVAASALTAGFGILATLLVLYRIIDPPGEAEREYGVFLGLIASAGIAAGGWMAMQEEGAELAGEPDRYGGPPEQPVGGAPQAPPPPPPEGGTGTQPPPPPPPPPSTGP
jgi:hypothetical protein